MKIEKIRILPSRLKRKEVFQTSKAEQKYVDSVFIEIKTGGLKGYGEGDPREHLTGETISTTVEDLDEISQFFIGKDLEMYDFVKNDLEDYYNKAVGPATSVAFETAVNDLESKNKDVPLYKILGRKRRDEVKYCGFIGSNVNHEEIADKARKQTEFGYDTIRVKAGLDKDEDIKRIRKLSEELPELNIWIDINQAWNKEEAYDVLSDIKDCNISMVEQPLDKNDFDGITYLKRKLEMPIMLDEAVKNEKDLENITKENIIDGINVKLVKSGSHKKVRNLCEMAKSNGLDVYFGGTTYTDIAASYARHNEFVLPLDYFSAGKARSHVLKENPVEPSLSYSSIVTLPNRQGLGVELTNGKYFRDMHEFTEQKE